MRDFMWLLVVVLVMVGLLLGGIHAYQQWFLRSAPIFRDATGACFKPVPLTLNSFQRTPCPKATP